MIDSHLAYRRISRGWNSIPQQVDDGLVDVSNDASLERNAHQRREDRLRDGFDIGGVLQSGAGIMPFADDNAVAGRQNGMNRPQIGSAIKQAINVRGKEGDLFEIAKEDRSSVYHIRVIGRGDVEPPAGLDDGSIRIKLTAGWRRVH